MLVYCAPGLSFRDPVTKLRVPPEGVDVDPADPAWARLIEAGDAVLEPPRAHAPQTLEGAELERPADAKPGVQIPTRDALTGEAIPPAAPNPEGFGQAEEAVVAPEMKKGAR